MSNRRCLNWMTILKPLRDFADGLEITLTLPLIDTLLLAASHFDKGVDDFARMAGVRLRDSSVRRSPLRSPLVKTASNSAELSCSRAIGECILKAAAREQASYETLFAAASVEMNAILKERTGPTELT